jgi:peptide/nickel transport system permease protein
MQIVVVVFVVTFGTFALIRLVPGDPATTILGAHATRETLAALRAELHLDVPLTTQLGLYLKDMAHGSLGTSVYQTGLPVTTIISDALPVTGALIAASVVISLVVGVPIGVWAGISDSRFFTNLFRGGTIVLLAAPPFLTGMVLLFVVAVRGGAAPAGGWGSSWPENVKYVWLPAVALSAGYLLPVIARTVWQSARETWQEPFIEATISRGLSRRRIVAIHVIPNSIIPEITVVGVGMGALIGGAVVIEVVFAMPGIGTQLVDAVQQRDYPVVQGVALVTAIIAVAVNMLADVLYVVVDPRTRRVSR